MKKETRNKISNQTGVTLIALVITIIVLIIIAGISIGTGISGIKQARENKLLTELGMMNHAVLERYTKASLTGETYPGVKITEAGLNLNAVISEMVNQSGQNITRKDNNDENYYYLTNANGGLEALGITNAEDEYIVNYETGEVINYTTKCTQTNQPLYMYSKDNT